MKIERVLIVDDEPDIRMIGKIALESTNGWTVGEAENGATALKMVSEFRPDVILLDVMMPEMDGPTTLRKLKDLPEASSIPVVFLTAKVQRTEIERYLSLGALGVIAKPFDPMSLAMKVLELIPGGQE